MPCGTIKAKRLLKQGKAKVVRRTPFTIKLLVATGETKQPLTHGVDTGSSKIGSAVTDEENNILYLSEIEIRNDITDRLKRRAMYRRTRRNRKTRYRKPRWLNRKNSVRKDRFSPTMTSKIDRHLKEIKFVNSILPISTLIIETGNFDPHALKNPAVLNNKWLYRRGTNYGFANTKSFVLDRDKYECQYCKGKSKDSRLEVHHIQFRSENGSDDVENLITLCKTCHDKVHASTLTLKLSGKHKSNLKHATQMNSIRVQLLKRLYCQETFGFITKEHRQIMGLSKEHYNDAIAVACLNNIGRCGLISFKLKTNLVIYKKCVSDGDYQQYKGIRSEQKIPSGKICGFRKFDKVEYLGKEYFIKGRMSTGYAILMDILGQKQTFKPIPKFTQLRRLGARKSWIIQCQIIASID